MEEVEIGKLVQGLSYDQYAAIPGLRASDLKLLKRSPAHWKMAQRRTSDALEFGKVFHLAIENPERFLDLHVVEPVFVGKTKDGRDSARSAEAKQMKAAWYSSLAPGTIVLPQEDADRMVGMLRAVLSHKLVSKLIKTGVRETSCWVDDDVTGERLKFRPDFISEKGWICDFKTTRDATPNFFINEIFSDRHSNSPFYVLSAAHYTHGAKLTRQLRGDNFVFIAIEHEAPFGINVFPLDSGHLDVGDRHREYLTKLYAKCKREDKWPCYEEKAINVEIPGYVQYPDYPEEEK